MLTPIRWLIVPVVLGICARLDQFRPGRDRPIGDQLDALDQPDRAAERRKPLEEPSTSATPPTQRVEESRLSGNQR